MNACLNQQQRIETKENREKEEKRELVEWFMLPHHFQP